MSPSQPFTYILLQGPWKLGMASIPFYEVTACAQAYSANYSKADGKSGTHGGDLTRFVLTLRTRFLIAGSFFFLKGLLSRDEVGKDQTLAFSTAFFVLWISSRPREYLKKIFCTIFKYLLWLVGYRKSCLPLLYCTIYTHLKMCLSLPWQTIRPSSGQPTKIDIYVFSKAYRFIGPVHIPVSWLENFWRYYRWTLSNFTDMPIIPINLPLSFVL